MTLSKTFRWQAYAAIVLIGWIGTPQWSRPWNHANKGDDSCNGIGLVGRWYWWNNWERGGYCKLIVYPLWIGGGRYTISVDFHVEK